MKIKEFIQSQIILPRLKQHGVLVVYDPEKRYQDLCLEIASEKFHVYDTSESSITSRFAVQNALLVFGTSSPTMEGVLVYVPAAKPNSDDEKQRDPFAIYAACGGVFPDGDGDEYQSLCLKAKPDHVTEIHRLFQDNPNVSFAVIDAIGGGMGWPTLQAVLKVESARDILFSFLAPSEAQQKALKLQEGWITEITDLFQAAIGFHLKTKIQSWAAISDEFWRFLLFSEFVFDLPQNLPTALNSVPYAPAEAAHLVEDLCERLRNDRRTQGDYIKHAEEIELELNLPAICQGITDFGKRDTFPFEERVCFNQAVAALKKEDMDQLRSVLKRHDGSVWISRGENETQWSLLKAAANLIQVCADVDRLLGDHQGSMESMISFFTNRMREADRLQREFEQAASDFLDLDGTEQEVISHARSIYRTLADKVQTVFLRLLEKSGWPVSGLLSNAEVFDTQITPKLKESGRRVALFMIDALRYELGVELSKHLQEAGQVDVLPVCAQLPTITPVGMASLLPEAQQRLGIKDKENHIAVFYDDLPLNNVSQRLAVLKTRYGQRFAETDLKSFVRTKAKIDPAVDLLVIRSNDMDQDFESNPEAAPDLISRTFQKIRSAVSKLRDLGFLDVVIATDHGFFLNTSLQAGNVCAKPPGNWINAHDRLLLGDGSGDTANLVLAADQMGIKGTFNQIAIPRSMAAYRAGLSYFHGGVSLQEAIIPVIGVRLRVEESKISSKATLTMRYKRGTQKITTRLPVIEVEASAADLFAQETEMIIEAYDPKGNVIGEAKLGGAVNPATRVITIKPNEILSVTIKMDMEYEGSFTVKVLDPITQAALGKSLELETDYTV